MKTSCCNSKESLSIGKSVICLNHSCNNYLGKTFLHRDFSSWKTPVVLSVFALQMMFSMEDFSMENNALNFNLIHNDFKKLKPLTKQHLNEELHLQNVLCADEVLAQMTLETAGLNSSLLQRTNNLMGMRYPYGRPTKACGIYIPSQNKIVYADKAALKKYAKIPNYAVYKCWQDAVADYKLWQDHNFKLKERYLDYLGKVYAEDSEYVAKIKTIAIKDSH